MKMGTNKVEKRMKDWEIRHTRIPNRVYINSIDGIVYIPAAVNMNVREACMFMVICKK